MRGRAIAAQAPSPFAQARQAYAAGPPSSRKARGTSVPSCPKTAFAPGRASLVPFTDSYQLCTGAPCHDVWAGRRSPRITTERAPTVHPRPSTV
jgi:hypothetical protein